MKLLIVVSEFPKLTETFAYRNVAEYVRMGHDARIFHIKPYRRSEVVHEFIRDLLPRAFTFAYLDLRTAAAVLAEMLRRPVAMARLIWTIAKAHRREGKRGLAVAALFPKAVALGRWCRRNTIDHIHAEFAGHPANAAWIAAQIADVPFSFSAHANDIFVSQALLARKARDASFVRSISRYNIRWLGDLPSFPERKLDLIRCGVGRALLDTPEPQSPSDGLRILYVGSLIRKKGVKHLLDALAMLPPDIEWQARIVGGGDLQAALRAQAERLGLVTRIRFDGAQPAEVVAEAYRWAHVIVVPSVHGKGGRVEGIPVVLMEAMAHGRAVIASRLSGIPELVEPGRTGWLTEAADAAGIAQALQIIAGDWPSAVSIARNGRQKIANEYLIEENAAALARRMEDARR